MSANLVHGRGTTRTDHRRELRDFEFGQPANVFGYDFAPELHVVEPEEGLIVLFPSSLFHRTVAFESDRQRISISFNCYGV